MGSTNLKIWRETCKIWKTYIYCWRALSSSKSSVFVYTCCRCHYSQHTSPLPSPTRHSVHRFEQSMDTLYTHTPAVYLGLTARLRSECSGPVMRGRGSECRRTHTSGADHSCVSPVDNETVGFVERESATVMNLTHQHNRQTKKIEE